MSGCSNDAKAVGSGIKKRGRKPKGGKIIPINQSVNNDDSEVVENIILHLKCSRTDINACDNFCLMNSLGTSTCEGVQSPNKAYTQQQQQQQQQQQPHAHSNDLYGYNYQCLTADGTLDCAHDCVSGQECGYGDADGISRDGARGRDVPDETNKSMLLRIQKKLHEIQYNYRNNTNYNTYSVCFWCTCDLNSDPIYIPKNVDANGTFNVYGHFCMLECALAYLMNEHIDSSVKYERSALLHYKYKDSYDCNSGIKPAPPPHYVLDKFYGNLSIEEYRMLYKTSKLVMVINKPITKMFPEIHEDNVDFVMKSKTIPAHNDNTTGCKLAKTSLFSNFVIVQ